MLSHRLSLFHGSDHHAFHAAHHRRRLPAVARPLCVPQRETPEGNTQKVLPCNPRAFSHMQHPYPGGEGTNKLKTED